MPRSRPNTSGQFIRSLHKRFHIELKGAATYQSIVISEEKKYKLSSKPNLSRVLPYIQHSFLVRMCFCPKEKLTENSLALSFF